MSERMEKLDEPFDELVLAKDNKCSISLKGVKEPLELSEHEFRVALLLKNARGNIVTSQDMIDILFGEPEGDLPRSNVDAKVIVSLRRKIETLSHGRFTINVWRKMGWYLFDTLHPNLAYDNPESSRNMRRGIVRNRRKSE